MVQPTDGVFIGLPQPDKFETVLTGQYFEAMDNFVRTFAFRPDDTFVFLADRKLDPRVIHAICGLARSRGIKPTVIVADNSQATEVPEELRPLVETATFVVSSWFCSIIDPFCIRMRNEKGQRWVKITYFRDLDLLKTPQARFPIDIVGEIIRQTADMFPKGQDFDLKFGDNRGTDLTIKYTAEMRETFSVPTAGADKWRPTSPAAILLKSRAGPNVYDRTSVNNEDSVEVDTNGVVVPYWAVGFETLREPATSRLQRRPHRRGQRRFGRSGHPAGYAGRRSAD